MGEEKRRSERVIPCVADEEVVVIQRKGAKNLLAKMMDLSEVGVLVYLLADADPAGAATLAIYHQGKIFEVPGTVVRKSGRLVAFDFASPSEDAQREIQSKLIRMEVAWERLSRRGL